MRFLRSLCTSHLTHHKLTSIRFDREGLVRSAYPITDHTHDDQSTFPPWALVPFFAFFTPFFGSMAFSFPWIPILISGYAAIAIAHFIYETVHVIHKRPTPLLIDGASATSAAARALSPQPRWPISWLDRVAFKRRRWMAKRP